MQGGWLLPAFGLLLALSTIRQQPPVQTDFEGYARFVTTGEFLVSHLVASIGGAGLAILGVCSVFVLLAGAFPPCRVDRDDHHRHGAGVSGVGFW